MSFDPHIQRFALDGTESASYTAETDTLDFGIGVSPSGRVIIAELDAGEDEVTVRRLNTDLNSEADFTIDEDDVAHLGILTLVDDPARAVHLNLDGANLDLVVRQWDGTIDQSTTVSDDPGDLPDWILGTDPFGKPTLSGPQNNGWTGSDGQNATAWTFDSGEGVLVGFESTEPNTFTYTLPMVVDIESVRESTLVVVCDGDVKTIKEGELETPTGGEGALNPEPFTVATAFIFGKVFFVDGDNFKYLDLDTDEVADVTASEGTAPEGMRLLARYRGRLVGSGIRTEPHNWFMSSVNDPFDWDFAPATTTSTQAVAGNLSPAGEIGDAVTALMPYNDDVLLVGCDKSLWMIANDPAAGGITDLITDQIGVAWGASWTKDPAGFLYFVGSDGVYRIAPGQQPESLTAGRLDETFRQMDLAGRRVLLGWDTQRTGLVVTFATGNITTPQESYFWDARANAWSEEQYIGFAGPTAMLSHDSEQPSDQTLLLGGKDGYIREFSDEAVDDDGSPIVSSVRYPPISPPDLDSEQIVVGIRTTLGQGSGSVRVNLYAAQTAEECWEQTNPRVTRTARAGLNTISLPRIRGSYTQIEVSHTGAARWAMASMAIRVQPLGLRRRRRF